MRTGVAGDARYGRGLRVRWTRTRARALAAAAPHATHLPRRHHLTQCTLYYYSENFKLSSLQSLPEVIKINKTFTLQLPGFYY